MNEIDKTSGSCKKIFPKDIKNPNIFHYLQENRTVQQAFGHNMSYVFWKSIDTVMSNKFRKKSFSELRSVNSINNCGREFTILVVNLHDVKTIGRYGLQNTDHYQISERNCHSRNYHHKLVMYI